MSLFGGLNYNDLGGTLDAEQGDRSSRGYTWHQIVDNFSRLFVTNLICVLFLVPALTGFMLGSLWNRFSCSPEFLAERLRRLPISRCTMPP